MSSRIIDTEKHPHRTIDLANDYETILAFSKVVHFLEVVPHMRDQKGEQILTIDEIVVFRKLYEPKFDRILTELVRRYNLKIEDIKDYATTPNEQGSTSSTTERGQSRIIVYTPGK
jgi:hypothetical protein